MRGRRHPIGISGMIAAAAALFAAAAQAQTGPGDTGNGHELARHHCARCHGIGKGQKRPKLSLAPTFQEIADNPARTALSLRVFLRTPHRNMPDLILTEAETDDLIAYIHSLR